MLRNLVNRFRSRSAMLAGRSIAHKPGAEKPRYRYQVAVPGEPEVVLRAYNQPEVRAQAREALGVDRLPAGTTVTRLD